MADNTINAYIKEIESLLICSKAKRKSFINNLRSDIAEYAKLNESISKEELISFFGSPEEIAQSFILNTDTAILKHRFGIKKVITAVLIALVIIYAVFAIVSFIDVHTEAHGYFKEGLLYILNTLTEVGMR